MDMALLLPLYFNKFQTSLFQIEMILFHYRRLDYFVVSERLVPKLSDSLIRQRVKGSDHCPVVLLLAL